MAAGEFHAGLRGLQLRPHQGARPQPGRRRLLMPADGLVHDHRHQQPHPEPTAVDSIQPVPLRFAAHRQRWAPHDQQGDADGGVELGGQPRDAGHRAPLDLLVRCGGPGRRYPLCEAERRGRVVPAAEPEDFARPSRAGGIHPAVWQRGGVDQLPSHL